MQFVARGVAVEFRQPPFAAVRRRRAVPATRMPVPEAAVNENRDALFYQNDVGTNETRARGQRSEVRSQWGAAFRYSF